MQAPVLCQPVRTMRVGRSVSLVSTMLAVPVDPRRCILPLLHQFDDLVLGDDSMLPCALQQLVPDLCVDAGRSRNMQLS